MKETNEKRKINVKSKMQKRKPEIKKTKKK